MGENRVKSLQSWNITLDPDNHGENGAVKQSDKNQTGGHKKGVLSRKNVILSVLFAICIPICFPLVHMLVFSLLWGHLSPEVDPKGCSCSCWDTIFKGPYETGIAGYKHVYFNSTSNTFKMWTITVIGVIFLYESFKRLFVLTLSKNLRYSMGFLFLSSIHSHYYAWWAHWNYWNDDFYSLWYHQVFFTVTESISSLLVIKSLDRRKHMSSFAIFTIANIAVFHICASSWDQFIETVVQHQGHMHQVLRDVFLMLTDLTHAGIAVYELKKYAHRKGLGVFTIASQRNNLCTTIFTFILMYLTLLSFP